MLLALVTAAFAAAPVPASDTLPVPSSAPAAALAPVWTEADALAAFERASPALAAARAAEEQARADETQAALRPNPQLGLGASNIPIRANATPSGNGGGLARNLVTTVELDQPFELGGKRASRVRAARSAVSEAGLGVEDAIRTARAELRRAFWNAVRAQARRELAEQVAQRWQDSIRIARVRFASDDVSRLDVEKVELEGLKNENDLADARAMERQGIAELLALAGPGAPREVRVQGKLESAAPALDVARLQDRALEARADVREARQHVETARAQLAVARAQRWPDLTAGVAWAHSRAIPAGDNPDTAALTVSVPLPLFNRNQGEIAKAASMLAQADRDRAAVESRAVADVSAAFGLYAAAREKVARYTADTLTIADRAVSVAEKSYRNGDASLLELLEAERTWIALRADWLDTLFELREAALDLQRATGVENLTESA